MEIFLNRRIAVVLSVLFHAAYLTNAKCVPSRHTTCPDEDNVVSVPTTAKPTLAPTPEPSASPTPAPTPEPSISPTVDCTANDYGFFGTTSNNMTEVEFTYSVEHSGTFENIRNTLEKAFNSDLIPAIFTESCGTSGSRKLNEALSSVVGISTGRDDTPLDGVTCDASRQGNECVVVSGSLNVFIEGDSYESLAASVSDGIRDKLKKSMDDGTFDSAHINIEQVKYVSQIVPKSGTGVEEPTNDITAEDGDGSSRLIYGIFGIMGGLVVIVLAVAWKTKERRRAAAEDDEMSLEQDNGSFPASPTANQEEVV